MPKRIHTVRSLQDRVLFEGNGVNNIPAGKWLAKKTPKTLKQQNVALCQVFNLGLLFGLPISSSILTPDEKDIGRFAKLWCFVLTIMKSVIFIFSLFYMYQIFPDKSTCLTFYGYNICGYISMLLFWKNRKLLYSSLQNLSNFLKVFSLETDIGGNNVTFQIILYISTIASVQIVLSIYVFVQEYNLFISGIYIPPIIPEIFKETYSFLAMFSILSSLCVSWTTSGFVFLMCRNLYISLAKLIQIYCKHVKERVRMTSFNLENMSNDISIFKNLMFRFYDVDNAITMHMLFLYATTMCGFINTVSVLVLEEKTLSSASLKFYVIWAFTTSFWAFFEMSSHGSHIIDHFDKLKRQLIEYSDKFVRSSPPMLDMKVFYFLYEIVMKSKLVVTGGGMFTINHKLMLTISGTFVTYSVLLLQLDEK